jgi:hypothetical protein
VVVASPDKPVELHDRAEEWESLASFAQDTDPGAVLGIVYGRRRQGKTPLLELLAEAAGGLAFTGLQQANVQNLADLATTYAAFTDSGKPRVSGVRGRARHPLYQVTEPLSSFRICRTYGPRSAYQSCGRSYGVAVAGSSELV